MVILHKDYDLWKNFQGIFLQIRGTEYSLGLWFLPLLYLTEMIVAAVIRQHKLLQIPMIALIAIAGFGYAHFYAKALPWGGDAALVASLFVYLGFIIKQFTLNVWKLDLDEIKRYKENCGKLIKWSEIILIPVSLLLNILFNTLNMNILSACVDMHILRYGNPIYYLCSSICGTAFILAICRLWIGNRKIKLFSFIGQNTIHIYCLHSLILSIMKKLNETIFIEQYCCVVLADLIMATITVLVCCSIIKIFNRCRAHFAAA